MLFLDTSGLFMLFNQKQSQHLLARDYFEIATRRFTHSYVLSEFVALALARNLPRIASLAFIQKIATHKAVQIEWVTHDLHHQALNLLQLQLDKSYSLCDAVSFVWMKQMEIRDALTTDHHFSQAGFVRLLEI